MIPSFGFNFAEVEHCALLWSHKTVLRGTKCIAWGSFWVVFRGSRNDRDQTQTFWMQSMCSNSLNCLSVPNIMPLLCPYIPVQVSASVSMPFMLCQVSLGTYHGPSKYMVKWVKSTQVFLISKCQGEWGWKDKTMGDMLAFTNGWSFETYMFDLLRHICSP